MIFKDIETKFCKWVSFEKMNYLALMMLDSIVHFHVIPRYNNSRTFEEKSFHDLNWPNHPSDLDSGISDMATVKKIRKRIILEANS